nr:hypothetical protein [Tanacetum cinerariifolium]
MTSMNTRLNIEKLDVNIVQKHGGSKQVGLKQLGHKQVRFKQIGFCVETRVHGVQDEKNVWFKVELQGAQENRKAEGFQVSNDDDAVAQRRLKDKQLKEKTNTNCLQFGSKQVEFKQLGHKQVRFKQLGPGVETGVREVQVDKRVWLEVERQGVQGEREDDVFQVSNDDTGSKIVGGQTT